MQRRSLRKENTDSVYHYDTKDKIFELGEKFAERQAEKVAEGSLDEKSEKALYWVI